MSELLDLVHNMNRLAALQRTNLLDSQREEAFDRFTRLAARICKVPIALMTLVDRDRQFFMSSFGLSEPWQTLRETPLTHSFCKHAVARRAPLVIGTPRRIPCSRTTPRRGSWRWSRMPGSPGSRRAAPGSVLCRGPRTAGVVRRRGQAARGPRLVRDARDRSADEAAGNRGAWRDVRGFKQ